jgi:hypothetical protein
VPHQDALGAEITPVVGSRSPKRRRTSSDPILVLPETRKCFYYAHSMS